jgi:hypothetical protein
MHGSDAYECVQLRYFLSMGFPFITRQFKDFTGEEVPNG